MLNRGLGSALAFFMLALLALSGCGGAQSKSPTRESRAAIDGDSCYFDPSACSDQTCADSVTWCQQAGYAGYCCPSDGSGCSCGPDLAQSGSGMCQRTCDWRW